MQYNFEWDPKKAKNNIKKHRVSFENAATAFQDPNAITIFDENYSSNEDRWVTMGISSGGPILIVHHTYEKIDRGNITLRIFSSRKANKNEQKSYNSE